MQVDLFRIRLSENRSKMRPSTAVLSSVFPFFGMRSACQPALAMLVRHPDTGRPTILVVGNQHSAGSW